MKKQYIIPIFVPHLGCPNDCIFCNQKSISGQKKNMTKEDLEAMLGQTIETVKKSVDEFDIDTFKATTRDKLNELEAKLEDFAAKVKDSDQYLTIRDGVVDLTQKVNDKIEEVKTKVLDSSVDDDYLEAFENEIENVEEKLDEMIEEIKD